MINNDDWSLINIMHRSVREITLISRCSFTLCSIVGQTKAINVDLSKSVGYEKINKSIAQKLL